jgi:hypothetical protein
MANITSTSSDKQLLKDIKALLIEVRDLDKIGNMRRYDVVDTLRGIGYILQTEDSLDEFADWDELRTYELGEHELGE